MLLSQPALHNLSLMYTYMQFFSLTNLLVNFYCSFIWTTSLSSFTIFSWQGLALVEDEQVFLDKFRFIKLSNILATFFFLLVYQANFRFENFSLLTFPLTRKNCPYFPIYGSNISLSRKTCRGEIAWCVHEAFRWYLFLNFRLTFS